MTSDRSVAGDLTSLARALTDRYAEDKFREVYRGLRGVDAIDQHSLGTLLASITSSQQWPVEAAPRFDVALPIRLEIASSQIGEVGQVLTDLDIELRRAAAFLSGGTTRPLRERASLTLLGARGTSSTTMFVSAAGSIYDALITKPLDVVLAMSWFWEHRLNRTKHQAQIATKEYLVSLSRIVHSAELALSAARPSVVAMRIDFKGVTIFEFRPA
jgi:hypothetical protein